jgi:methylated-DNA-[protein]-cysteine S-methyltransferase
MQNIGITKTPLGSLGIVEEDGAIVQLLWNAENAGFRSDLIKEGLLQLEAFFAGKLTTFDLPLRPRGTPFQLAVYDQMLSIPHGHTRTYGEIATQVDGAAQAVGNACGSNPIPVIIPCHRVLAANGLGGFSGAGGVEDKVWLLRHEGAGSFLI